MKMTGRGDENFVIAAHAVRVCIWIAAMVAGEGGGMFRRSIFSIRIQIQMANERRMEGRKEGGAENERTQQLFMPRLSSPPRPWIQTRRREPSDFFLSILPLGFDGRSIGESRKA